VQRGLLWLTVRPFAFGGQKQTATSGSSREVISTKVMRYRLLSPLPMPNQIGANFTNVETSTEVIICPSWSWISHFSCDEKKGITHHGDFSEHSENTVRHSPNGLQLMHVQFVPIRDQLTIALRVRACHGR
jgi:hypothetical protein